MSSARAAASISVASMTGVVQGSAWRFQETQCSTGAQPLATRLTLEAGIVQPPVAGEKGLEGRLDALARRHHRLDHAGDLLQDHRHGAEVEGERHHLAAGLPHQGDEAVVGPQVGVAPAIDRLLGIAHQEEPGALLHRPVEGDPAQEVALDAVGVLELVDEELVDPPPHLPAHVGLIGEERRGAGEQEVEGGDAVGAELALDPPEQGDQRAAAVLHQLGIEAGRAGRGAGRGGRRRASARLRRRRRGRLPFAPRDDRRQFLR